VTAANQDRIDKDKDHKHARGNVWITSSATIATAVLTLIGTLAGIYLSPKIVAEKIAPNAAVTTTVTTTVQQTVQAIPLDTVQPTVTPTVDPSPGAPIYLTDLKDDVTDSYGNSGSGAFKINGNPYIRSVAGEIWSPNYTVWAEYTLDGSYRTFKATLGLNDEVATDSAAEFVISGNGKILFKETVQYTQEVKMTVNVSDLVKLRIAVTRVGGKPASHPRGAVFGDATLSR
jgi:hypothetical protein